MWNTIKWVTIALIISVITIGYDWEEDEDV